MTRGVRLWPLLTALHRYDKSFSTRGRGEGTLIDAPILAYLIETPSGRILVDVGCDYRKLSDPALRARWFERPDSMLPVPSMNEEQRIPSYLERLGLSIRDVDAVVLTHFHFDHAGGLHDFLHADVHVHEREVAAAREPADSVYFSDEIDVPAHFRVHSAELDVYPGVRVIETPGHTAGHVSVLVELSGGPVLLAGDAADLSENIDQEIAPGLCYRDDPEPAIRSIQKLKEVCELHAHILEEGPVALLHRIVDSMIDDYAPELAEIEDQMDELEEEVILGAGDNLVRPILAMKRDLAGLRRVLIPQRDVVGRLARREFSQVSNEMAYRFRDVYDHLVRYSDEAAMFQDRVTGILEGYLSSISNRLNQVMKVLTVMSTIFLPLTVLTGMWGMNVPLPAFPGGEHAQFWWVFGLMVTIIGGMLVVFRRKRWI